MVVFLSEDEYESKDNLEDSSDSDSNCSQVGTGLGLGLEIESHCEHYLEPKSAPGLASLLRPGL
ncbi:hypothetical protein AAVH_28525, partial [Aphelenchoides avenae]